MSTFRIKIATFSDIIARGLISAIASFRDHRTIVETIRPDSANDLISDFTSNEIIIADTAVFSSENLTMLKASKGKRPIVIGLYISALPANVTRHYDHLLSLYADQKQIHNIIAKAISDIDTTDQHTAEELTPREKEIVIGVVKGESNKEIANRLNVSVHTVTTHRRNIASKLQIHSPSALTIYAIVSKLVAIDEIKSELI